MAGISAIFVTLQLGQYGTRWISAEMNGSRELQWQTRGEDVSAVRQGTQVWVRNLPTEQSYTLVGEVVEKTFVRWGEYKVVVDLTEQPQTIVRNVHQDQRTHWTILRLLGIAHDGHPAMKMVYA